MNLSEYFIDRLNELKNNDDVKSIFSYADKNSCKESIDYRMIFHNESVRGYYNIASGTVKNYSDTGLFAQNDNKELAEHLYTYFCVLKYVANTLDDEDKKFHYDKESIDKLIAEFLEVVRDICLFYQRKMNQD